MNHPPAVPISEGELPFADPQTPRLSIFHLMLWTLCSAVYLALTRAVYSASTELPDGYAQLQNLSGMINGVIMGAVFAGAIVLAHQRIRVGPPMLRHPGHWLLFVSAVFAVVHLPVMLLLVLTTATLGWPLVSIYGLAHLILPVAYFSALLHSSELRWKVFFAALAVLGALQGLSYIGMGIGFGVGQWLAYLSAIPSLAGLFLVVWLAVVSVLDIVGKRRRDWLHWAGVATYMAGRGSALIWVIGSWFVQNGMTGKALG